MEPTTAKQTAGKEPGVRPGGQGDSSIPPSKLERVLASVWPMFGGHAANSVIAAQEPAEGRKTRRWLGNLTGFGRAGASSSGTTLHYRPPTCVR